MRINFFIIVAGALIITHLLLRLYVDHKIGRLEHKKLYEELTSFLDSIICKFTYPAIQRELKKLDIIIIQGNPQSIGEQFDFIFYKMKVPSQVKTELAQRAFFFYLEQGNYHKCEEMIKICQEESESINATHTMEIIYGVLVEKKSEYIDELTKRLQKLEQNDTNNGEEDADTDNNTLNKGILEYLIGLQHKNAGNLKESKQYFRDASMHCRGTVYEKMIEKDLNGDNDTE